MSEVLMHTRFIEHRKQSYLFAGMQERASAYFWQYLSIIYLVFGLTSCQGQSGPNLLWMDDFEDGDSQGWLFYDEVEGPSEWYVEGGYLNQASNIGSELRGTIAVSSLESWDDYTLSVDLAVTDDDYIGVVFRYQNPQNYYRVCVSSDAGRIRLDKIVNDEIINLDILTMMWPLARFNISVDVRGDAIRVYLDQHEYFSLNDTSFSSGQVGVMACYNQGGFYDKIEVWDELPIVEADEGTMIFRGPYLQSVLGDSATVMWNTNRNSNSIVEYGPIGTDTELVLESALVKNHEVVLTNLLVNTDYTYRVYSDTVSSPWYQFRSAKSAAHPFSFAIYGDSQLNFLRHSEIATAVASETIDLVTHCGDVVTYGPRPDWDAELFGPAADLFREKAVYVSIGNHSKQSPNFNRNFAFPNSEHETYYSFTYGNAYFIFLNNPVAAYPEVGYPSISEGSEQYEWLESVLASDECQAAEWRFVYGHIPVFSEGTNNDYPINRETLIPLFGTYGVDMYFAGHVHNFERGYSEGTYYVVTGGGGGVLGHRVRDIPEITVQRNGHHYCTVNINGPLLSFVAKTPSGTLIDQLIIDKTTGISEESKKLLPNSIKLKAFPNPFNASSHVEISIPLRENYSIKIYDLSGRMMRDLGKHCLEAGEHQFQWDGNNESGISLASGVYTFQIESATLSKTIQLSLLK